MAHADAPSDQDEAVHEPAPGRSKPRTSLLAPLMDLFSKVRLPSMGRERHDHGHAQAIPAHQPHDPAAPAHDQGQAQAQAHPTGPARKPAARFPFLGLKREARVGIAALLTFVLFVTALVVRQKIRGPVTLAMNPVVDGIPSDKDKPKEGEKPVPEKDKVKDKEKDKPTTPPSPTEAPAPGGTPGLPLTGEVGPEPPPPVETSPASRIPSDAKKAEPEAPPSTAEVPSKTLLPPDPTDPLRLPPEAGPPAPSPSPAPAPAPSTTPAVAKAADPDPLPNPAASVPLLPDPTPPVPVAETKPAAPDGLPSMGDPPSAPAAVPAATATATEPPPALPPPVPAITEPPPAPPSAPPTAPSRVEASPPIRAERTPPLETVPSLSPSPSTATEAATATAGAGWIVIPSGGKRIPGSRSIVSTPADDPAEAPRVVDGPRPIADPDAVDQVEPVLHRVQAGENFFTISLLYYQSPKFYRALHAANARQVPKIDELYIGTVLRIPPPEALDRSLIDRPSRSNDPAASTVSRTSRVVEPAEEAPLSRPTTRPRLLYPEAEPAARPVRRPTYTVKDNETLRSIARDTLGDSRRSDEIYNLNRDTVADRRGTLRAGTLLTLPEDAIVGRKVR